MQARWTNSPCGPIYPCVGLPILLLRLQLFLWRSTLKPCEELDDREVFSKLSTSGLGCQPKNASRQYKRTVKRFGLSVTLGSLQWLNLFISGTTQLKMDFLMLIQPLYILRALLALISGTFRHPTISMRRMGLWSDLPTCGPLIS